MIMMIRTLLATMEDGAAILTTATENIMVTTITEPTMADRSNT